MVTEIDALSADLGLDDNERRLASIIGLVHDIGRFEQFTQYRTFDDRKSLNHAELGLQILEQAHALHALPPSERRIANRAIWYHNQPGVPKNESEAVLLFARLIRDADKLDIWHVCLDEYSRNDGKRNHAIAYELPDTPGASEPVELQIAEGRVVDGGDLRNLNDFKLFQLSWVFDVNFAPTFQRIDAQRLVERIASSIRGPGERTRRLFELVHHFIQERLHNI